MLTPSLVSVFPGSNWVEREVWDMFGIFLVIIMTCVVFYLIMCFEGHPLRKDFPLNGYLELRYDDTKRRIVTEPIQVSQEFRLF